MTSRLTPVIYDDATPEQQQVWDAVLASRGDPSRLIGSDGSLVGPFNHMVTSPKLGRPMSAMGHAVRFENDVDNRLLELAICTVGAHWRSNFEFWAHSRLGVAAGLDQSVMDSLAEGRTPTFERDDERVIHGFASQLVSTGRVDQDRYDAAREILGEQGLADLITTIGYYSLISLTLNAHAVSLPEGQTPFWADE